MSTISGVQSFMSMLRTPRADGASRAASLSPVAADSVIGATPTTKDEPTSQDLLIEEIMKKGGLMKWGQEQRLEELKAKLRADVLKGLGMTEDDLAKMQPDQRAELEKRIDEMIRVRLEAALADGKDQQDKESLAPGQPAPKAKPSLIINV